MEHKFEKITGLWPFAVGIPEAKGVPTREEAQSPTAEHHSCLCGSQP